MASVCASPSGKQTLLWTDRNFLRLWIGTMVSSFGDGAYFILLGWFVIATTGNDLKLGTALICASVPRLLFMLVGGATADRMSRRTILVGSVFIRAIVLLLFSALLLWHPWPYGMGEVYVMTLIFGTVDAFFWPANSSIVPQVAPKSRLSTANSIISTSQQFSMIIGPLLASGLLLLHHYWIMFAGIAVLFLLAGLCLSQMRLLQPRPDSEGSAANGTKQNFLKDVHSGIQYVLGIRSVTLIMVASLVINLLLMGPFNIGLPVLVKSFGWSGSVYGTFESAVGLGAIVGGLVVGLMKGLRGHLRLLGFIMSFMGIAFAPVGFSHSVPTSLSLLAVVGVSMSIVNIPIITYVQTIVEERMMGRVMALMSLMSTGLTPVSYALCSLLLGHHLLSVEILILGGGLTLGLFSATLFFFRGFRRMEDNPAWVQAGEPGVAN